MYILLLTLLFTAVIRRASCICNPYNGPENESPGCVHVEGYDQEQCAACITTSWYRRIRPQCVHNKHCLDRTRRFCYYTCMLQKYDKSGGTVYPNCQCRQNILPNECYSPSGQNCEWYIKCLEKRHSCSGKPDGYAIEYGYKFCKEYEKDYHHFSNDGQKWIDKVRLCLQRSLIDVLSPCKHSHCSDIKNQAFRSHRDCYVSPSPDTSICSLPFNDQIKIIKIGVLALIYSDSSAKMDTISNMIGTIDGCIKYNWPLQYFIAKGMLILLIRINPLNSGLNIKAGFELDYINDIRERIPHLNQNSRFKLLGKRNYQKIIREKRRAPFTPPVPFIRDFFNLYIIDMYYLNDTTIHPSSNYQLSLNDISNILNNSVKLGLFEFNSTNRAYYIEEISYCHDLECTNLTSTISASPFRQNKVTSFRSKLKWFGGSLLTFFFLLLIGIGANHK